MVKLNLPCHEQCRGNCNKNRKIVSDLEVKEKAFNYSHVIFNLDGVILDVENVYFNVIKDIISKYNVPNPNQQAGVIVDLQDQETARKLCDDFNLPVDPDDFLEEFKNVCLKHLAKSTLVPGVENLIQYFYNNGVLMGIVTFSTEEAFKWKTQKYMQIIRKFDVTVLGGSDSEITEKKPSGQIYQVAFSRFQNIADINKCLVFENTPEGVLSAKNAGHKVVWLKNKHICKCSSKINADLVIDSLDQFDPSKI